MSATAKMVGPKFAREIRVTIDSQIRFSLKESGIEGTVREAIGKYFIHAWVRVWRRKQYQDVIVTGDPPLSKAAEWEIVRRVRGALQKYLL